MSGRAGIRGSRLSSFPTTEVDRGAELASRQLTTYWCAADHETTLPFASDVAAPEEWACGQCGAPATLSRGEAPAATGEPVFFRTPYQFLMMRRTEEEGEVLLQEALDALARRRGTRD